MKENTLSQKDLLDIQLLDRVNGRVLQPIGLAKNIDSLKEKRMLYLEHRADNSPMHIRIQDASFILMRVEDVVNAIVDRRVEMNQVSPYPRINLEMLINNRGDKVYYHNKKLGSTLLAFGWTGGKTPDEDSRVLLTDGTYIYHNSFKNPKVVDRKLTMVDLLKKVNKK